jgi:hypothetical protein
VELTNIPFADAVALQFRSSYTAAPHPTAGLSDPNGPLFSEISKAFRTEQAAIKVWDAQTASQLAPPTACL